MPITPSVTAANLDVDKLDQNLSKNEFMASDGKNYKFLGNQWAQILPSGKTGRLARKKISQELNKLAGKKQVKNSKTINQTDQSPDQYQSYHYQ